MFFLLSILIAHTLDFPSHQFVSAGRTVEDDSGKRRESVAEAKDDGRKEGTAWLCDKPTVRHHFSPELNSVIANMTAF